MEQWLTSSSPRNSGSFAKMSNSTQPSIRVSVSVLSTTSVLCLWRPRYARFMRNTNTLKPFVECPYSQTPFHYLSYEANSSIEGSLSLHNKLLNHLRSFILCSKKSYPSKSGVIIHYHQYNFFRLILSVPLVPREGPYAVYVELQYWFLRLVEVNAFFLFALPIATR
ncbi:hypothetical protein Tco_0684488 [Tanacetum coccineum]|uniref:Uncharacterized protein n=1 Tax=Tanacetum coccineum TaxID=301880 RepID=A0ABQ4X191_9ASTR